MTNQNVFYLPPGWLPQLAPVAGSPGWIPCGFLFVLDGFLLESPLSVAVAGPLVWVPYMASSWNLLFRWPWPDPLSGFPMVAPLNCYLAT